MTSIDRRRFLEAVPIAAASLWGGLRAQSASGRQLSPNEKPHIALIGCGGQGSGDVQRALPFGNLVALCDVDSNRIGYVEQNIADAMGGTFDKQSIDKYEDYRAIIDRDDIDAIICATVDHWHVKIAVEAMRSGKDVYCEKPLTLTVDEGRIISKAVEETGRVVQVGTQQRSDWLFLKAVALAHAGRLGKIQRVTVGINRNPFSKALPAVEPPKHLNWNLWKGPTPDVPYRYLKGGKEGQNLNMNLGDGGADASNCFYEFRWWLEYSGGKMTDWGAHHVDIAQWLIQQNGPGQGPSKITPVMIEHSVDFDTNGMPVVDDRYNVPKAFTVQVEFPNAVLMEISSEPRNGLLVEGTKGRIFVNRGTLSGKPVEELAENPFPEGLLEKLYGGPIVSHTQNFFDCVASRKQPVSDVWSHVSAINTCHLANIALRLNRPLEWDAQQQQVKNNSIATELLSRESRKGFEIES